MITPDSLASKTNTVCGAQCGKLPQPASAKAGLYSQAKEFFSGIFDTHNWPSRWHCGTWSEFHGWLYIFSDLLIAVAYFAIPILLIILLTKRKDVPFPKILWLFVIFIILCGCTHFIDAGIFWWPAYRLSALLRLFTGIVSVTAVYVLYQIMPTILSLRSVGELQKEIKERKIAEEKLAASEFLLMEAGRIGKFGGWELDFITNKVTWSKAIYDIHELPYDFDPTFYDATRFYLQPYYSTITGAIDECRLSGKGYNLELQILTAKNNRVWVRSHGEPLYDENQEVTKLRGIFMDIDKYKLNEISLNRTVEMVTKNNQQLKNFTHILSHNIRNHASNISLVSSLIDESTLDEDNAELFQKIKRISEGLNTTLEDLSSAIKIKDDVIESERISFKEITDNILKVIESDVAANHAVITRQFEVEEITFPKIYLESILLNLLSNTLKYRNPLIEPKVLLKTYKDQNGDTVLECTDNGIGIDLELHEKKIFGLYKTFHDRKDSHGVGLFLTKTQVESQGMQALGIAVGKLCHLSILNTLYLSRILNGLLCVALCFLALILAKQSNILLFIVLLFPMTVSLFASVSQDAVLIGCCFLLVGFIDDWSADDNEHQPKWKLYTMVVLMCIIGVAKPPYIIFAFLFLFLKLSPKQKAIGIITPFAILALWLIINHGSFMIKFAPAEMRINSKLQVLYILHHPMKFMGMFFHPDTQALQNIAHMFVGVLAWLDLSLPSLYYRNAYICLFLGIIISLGFTGNARLRIALITCGIITIVAVISAQYVTWTALQSPTLSGMQGRYLLPIFPFIALALCGYTAINRLATLKSVLLSVVLLFPVYSAVIMVQALLGRYY